MCGVAMPQTVYPYRLVYLCRFHCILEHRLYTADGIPPTVPTFKKVSFGLVCFIIFPQQIQHCRRQWYIPIFLSFTRFDEYLHPSTVDVAHFQIDNLTYSQPHSVAQLQHQQMFSVLYHVEYPFYFLLAQHLWQSGWLPRPWDFGKEIRFMEHLFKIEFDGVEPAVQLAF